MTTNVPAVTVVSGYYNRAHTVPASMRSILEQTFEDFEYIVFDDASTDGTFAALAAFGDPRVRLVKHERNTGFVRGMIDAVASARGAYVAVHGSGDISHPTRLARQVALLDAHQNVGAIGVHRRNVHPDGRVLSVVRPDESGLTLEGLRRSNVYSHGEVMYRRDLYTAVGGYRPQFTFAQDRDLWLRMVRHARLGMVPEVLYDRFVQPDGVSFVPAKAVRQALFSELGVALSYLDAEAQASLLAHVDEVGVEHVAIPRSSRLERHFARKVVALGVAGRWDEGVELARILPLDGPRGSAAKGVLATVARIGAALDRDGHAVRWLARLAGRGADGL